MTASEPAVAFAPEGPDTTALGMVAVYPRVGEAEVLAAASGLDPADLHVTLVFLGDVEDFDAEAATAAVAVAAEQNQPLGGAIGGVGMFAEGEDGIPVILLPDVQGLTKLREDAVAALAEQGIASPSEHGFLPHLTLLYADGEEMPDTGLIGSPVHFDAISVVVGGRRTDYPLGGSSEEASVDTVDQMALNLKGPWGSLTYSPSASTPIAAEPTSAPIIGAGSLSPEQYAALATITVETDAPAADAAAESVQWEAILALEGVPTDDNGATPRIIMPDAMSWRDTPFPLLAMTEIVGEGHMGQKVAGRVDQIWREPMASLGDGVMAIKARGVFDTGEFGQEIARMVGDQTLRGVSIDPGAVEWSFVLRDTLEPVAEADMTAEDYMNGAYFAAMISGKILGATVCPMQAIEGATIEILTASAEQVEVRVPRIWLVDDEAMTACAAGPLAPPAEWFANPHFTRPTPITVTDEGRVFGHISTWECHAGYEDRCMIAPRSRDGYARFHTGGMVTAEGEHIRVGRIQVKPHAPRHMTQDEVIAYYSDPATVGAFGCLYEDAWGVAFAGVTRSDAPPELLRDFYANPPSGEWRRGELLGISSVPLPGLPVVAPQAYLVASGGPLAEVEVLLLPPVLEADCGCESDDVDILVAAATLAGPEALADLVIGQ